MTPGAIISALIVWTPFLAEGFLWNILISMVAMALGTAVGVGLALTRLSGRPVAKKASEVITSFARNTPTFAFQFYIVFMLPSEFLYGGVVYAFPNWLKAALALSVAVAGFVSIMLPGAILHWRAGEHDRALLFVPSWTAYFLIIVMASSTASVIGVGEIISHCNTVIEAVGSNDLMLWIYLYAMLWFFAFCFPLNHLMYWVRNKIARRIGRSQINRRVLDGGSAPAIPAVGGGYPAYSNVSTLQLGNARNPQDEVARDDVMTQAQ